MNYAERIRTKAIRPHNVDAFIEKLFFGDDNQPVLYIVSSESEIKDIKNKTVSPLLKGEWVDV